MTALSLALDIEWLVLVVVFIVVVVVWIRLEWYGWYVGVVPILLQSIETLLKFCNTLRFRNTYSIFYEICNTYCNTLEILQYLLQYFRYLEIFIAMLLKFFNSYCNIFEILQYFERVAILFAILVVIF